MQRQFLAELNASFGLELSRWDGHFDGEGLDGEGGEDSGEPGDIVLQMSKTACAAGYANNGTYLLDAPALPAVSDATHTGRPILIDAPTTRGIQEGLATLRRSLGSPADPSALPSGLALPSCFVLDAPSASGNTRWLAAAATTDLHELDGFVQLACASRDYQPSHSRVVRRVTSYSRSDGSRVQVAGRGLGTLVGGLASDSGGQHGLQTMVTVQFGETDAVETLPLALVAEPINRSTEIDWSTCMFAERSGSGKGGVYFVEFPNGRAIVVKPTDEPASELAGYQIGLLLGVRMPVLVGLNAAHGEGLTVCRKLLALDRSGRLKNDKADVSSIGQFPYLIVQEFQRGRTLKDICHAGDGLGWAEATFGPMGGLSVDGVRRLRELGAIIAFDVIMHNSDRWYLEGVFNNFSRCGNMANIMFTDDGDPVAIDNTTTAYDATVLGNGARFATYLQSVSDLVARAKARTKSDDEAEDNEENGMDGGVGLSRQVSAHSAMKGVRRFFMEGQGISTESSYVPGLEYDIGEAGVQEIERGFVEVVSTCRQKGEAFRRALRAVELNVRRELGAALDEAWLDLCAASGPLPLPVAACSLMMTETSLARCHQTHPLRPSCWSLASIHSTTLRDQPPWDLSPHVPVSPPHDPVSQA